MKKLSLLGLILLLIQIVLPFGEANAEGSTNDVIFGTKIQNELTEDEDVDVYKFTLVKPSRVTWNLKSYIDGYVDSEILDGNEVTQIIEERLEATPSTPNIWSSYVDLEAGTYYFKVKKYEYSNDTGNYELTINAKSYENNDQEWNNSTLESQIIPLSAKQVGLISWNDDIDVYKFTLEQS